MSGLKCVSMEGNDQELVERVRVKMKENKRILRFKTPKEGRVGRKSRGRVEVFTRGETAPNL